jgi:hypothetical protein
MARDLWLNKELSLRQLFLYATIGGSLVQEEFTLILEIIVIIIQLY